MKRSALSVIALLVVSLFVSVRATAAESRVDSGNERVGNTVIAMNRHDLMRMAKRLGLAIRPIPLSTEMKAKIASLPRKGCGCSPDEVDSFGSCLKACVGAFGVSYGTLVACGAVCTGAMSGNPIAIAVCAICLGVGEDVVMGCSLYCVYYPGGKSVGGIMDVSQARSPHTRTSASVGVQLRRRQPMTKGL